MKALIQKIKDFQFQIYILEITLYNYLFALFIFHIWNDVDEIFSKGINIELLYFGSDYKGKCLFQFYLQKDFAEIQLFWITIYKKGI